MAVANKSTVRVEGLTGLRRAFRAAGKAESKGLTIALREAVEPVAEESTALARAHIREGRLDWSAMRIGTTAHAVYVAPARRRSSGSPRPNLAGILLSDAMLPALEANSREVAVRVDQLLEVVGRVWETTR